MKLVFDIEGNALLEVTQPKQKSKPLQKEATKVWCVCCLDIDTNETYNFKPNEIDSAVRLLRQADLLIGHNIIEYDIPLLERLHGPIETEVFDTLIVSRLKYPDIQNHPFGGNSLDSWGYHLGNEKIEYKDGFDSFNQNMFKYCKQDVQVNALVYKELRDFADKNPGPVKLEHDVAKIIAKQTANGISFDLHGANQLEQDLSIEKADLYDKLCTSFPPIVEEQRYHKTTGKPLKRNIEHFNPTSGLQIARRFGEKYNQKFALSDKDNPVVTTEVLKKLKHPEAKLILDYRAIDKITQQLTDWRGRAALSRDGKIHGSVNTQGCVTGRMSASQPNLQQVNGDPRARRLFMPRKGWVQVGIDAAGLEARILANRLYRWDNGKYATEVLEGDVHTANQKAMALSSRADAKQFLYALVFGAGDEKMGKIVGGNVHAGRKAKEMFFKANPAFLQLLENVKFQVAKKGTVQLLDKREVPCRSDHKALNLQIQGDGAVLMKVALRDFYNKLIDMFESQCAFMATVHDEWQVECDPTIADMVGKLGVSCIEMAGQDLGCSVAMSGEYKIGKDWSECH